KRDLSLQELGVRIEPDEHEGGLWVSLDLLPGLEVFELNGPELAGAAVLRPEGRDPVLQEHLHPGMVLDLVLEQLGASQAVRTFDDENLVRELGQEETFLQTRVPSADHHQF